MNSNHAIPDEMLEITFEALAPIKMSPRIDNMPDMLRFVRLLTIYHSFNHLKVALSLGSDIL